MLAPAMRRAGSSMIRVDDIRGGLVGGSGSPRNGGTPSCCIIALYMHNQASKPGCAPMVNPFLLPVGSHVTRDNSLLIALIHGLRKVILEFKLTNPVARVFRPCSLLPIVIIFEVGVGEESERF